MDDFWGDFADTDFGFTLYVEFGEAVEAVEGEPVAFFVFHDVDGVGGVAVFEYLIV